MLKLYPFLAIFSTPELYKVPVPMLKLHQKEFHNKVHLSANRHTDGFRQVRGNHCFRSGRTETKRDFAAVYGEVPLFFWWIQGGNVIGVIVVFVA